MNCQETRMKLSEYLEGALEPGERESLEGHLAACPACEREAGLLDRTVRAVAGLPSAEPPAGFAQRVMVSVEKERRKRRFWNFLFDPWKVKIPIHATALVLVGVFAVYLYHGGPPADLDQAEPLDSRPADSLRGDAPISPRERRETLKPLPSLAPSRGGFAQRSEFADRRLGGALSTFEEAAKQSFRDLEMVEKDALLGPGSKRESSTAGRAMSVSPTRFELVLSLSPDVAPEDIFRDRLADLVRQVGGGRLSTEGTLERAGEEGRPDIFWVSIPLERYDQLKNELASWGTLQAESIFYFSQDEPATKIAGSIPVKVTLLPARK